MKDEGRRALDRYGLQIYRFQVANPQFLRLQNRLFLNYPPNFEEMILWEICDHKEIGMSN